MEYRPYAYRTIPVLPAGETSEISTEREELKPQGPEEHSPEWYDPLALLISTINHMEVDIHGGLGDHLQETISPEQHLKKKKKKG